MIMVTIDQYQGHVHVAKNRFQQTGKGAFSGNNLK